MSTFKKAFTSRFGTSNGVIMEVDWNQLEINCLQVESQDQTLAKELNANLDLHTQMTSIIYATDYGLIKTAIADGVKVWKDRRTKTKRARFALQYGAGRKRIADLTGWNEDAARLFIEKYYSHYAGLDAWEVMVCNEVNASRQPSGPNGEAKGQYTSPTGRRFVFTTSESKYQPGVQAFSHNQLKNWPIQGLAADFVAHMTGKLFRDLLYYDMAQYIIPINTIHDSVVLDVHREVLDIAEQIVHDTYGKAQVGMLELVQGKRPVTIPFRYSVTTGTSWAK